MPGTKVSHPWDNAMQEPAIGTIKADLVDRHDLNSRTQARLRLFDYIENFDNPIRARSSLAMLSQNEYEAQYHHHALAGEAA